MLFVFKGLFPKMETVARIHYQNMTSGKKKESQKVIVKERLRRIHH